MSQSKATKYKSVTAAAAGSAVAIGTAVLAWYQYNTTQQSKTKTTMPLHPLLDNGIAKGSPSFAGGKLRCHCRASPVEVTLDGNVAHNHACGCSKCWKPAGALFSVIAVVPRDQLHVTANADKLYVVDPDATIRRHACSECGVHMFGRIDKDHAFKGLDFVHVELSDDKGWQEPQFAAFVSSIVEQGFPPAKMDDVRAQFARLGLPTYDSLSPPLMDLLAAHAAKQSGLLAG